MVILLFIAHPPFKNVLVLCKEREILKGRRERLQREFMNPLGAFILEPSGKTIS
jgi:hypothetical protein